MPRFLLGAGAFFFDHFIHLLMKQLYSSYGAEDFEVWKTLFDRQQQNLIDKACTPYLSGMKELAEVLNSSSVPRFGALNKVLKEKTGWTIVVVPGLIPVDEFFAFLAKRQFCSSTWLRAKHQLDYLEEPDMFHDIYGHIPILMDPLFADFTHKMGLLGQKFQANPTAIKMLERLYWFTIEFGITRQNGMRKIYGAGILSSFGETNHIYEDSLEIRPFDLERVMTTDFDSSMIQSMYYELDAFEQLADCLDQVESILNAYCLKPV